MPRVPAAGGGPQRGAAHARSRGQSVDRPFRTARLEIAAPRFAPPPDVQANSGGRSEELSLLAALPVHEINLTGERRRALRLPGRLRPRAGAPPRAFQRGGRRVARPREAFAA